MRQQTQFLWETYFSSVDKIVMTTLEIVKDRISRHLSRASLQWNHTPGGLVSLPQYSENLQDFPFYLNAFNLHPSSAFTAVIYATSPIVTASSAIYKLMKNVVSSQHVDKVVVIWVSDKSPPLKNKWPSTSVPIIVIKPQNKTINSRFYPHVAIQTDAVLGLDEDVLLTTSEVNFAFSVWKSFPERIVGYAARNHYWDDYNNRWGYTSKMTNDYSMVLTGAAFYHRYYPYLFTHHLTPELHSFVGNLSNCEDILMNFLVSHVTKLPPIKLSQRRQYREAPAADGRATWSELRRFAERQTCFNTFADAFGGVPLARSGTRFDPVLFRDPVANFRKKYRQMELVNS
ncbi:PREDICTED: exostosin-1a-like [Priapulus caudatus]|uniref:Exostosin-1a-like n=1 Tax=Priapulus caudatus TaxID=37621 RepID=A0ABM1DTN5_PRICU|nr:PREDICTED: exostosin-1a-like [Priapulus caudatus]